MIKTLTRNELLDFTKSTEYKQLIQVPTSPFRALSFFHNPRGRDEQIIMLLYYENQELVGYLGVLADHMYWNEKPTEVAWLSALWVSETQRRKGTAYKMVMQMHTIWNGHLMVSNWAPESKRLFDKTDIFTSLVNLQGKRFYLRLCLHDVLPPKKKLFRLTKPLLYLTDVAFNTFRDGFLAMANKKNYNFNFQTKANDNEKNELIKQLSSHLPSKRSIEEFEWILKYPWIKETAENEQDFKNYAFSYKAKRFCQGFIYVSNNEGMVNGLVFYTIRDNWLKIPYLYHEENDWAAIGNAIIAKCKNKRISVLTIFHQEISNYIQASTYPILKSKPLNFEIMISKKLNISKVEETKSRFQAGEGDYIFT